MGPFKDFKLSSLTFFQQETGSASFSIFLGDPWQWKSRQQKCSQRKADRSGHLVRKPGVTGKLRHKAGRNRLYVKDGGFERSQGFDRQVLEKSICKQLPVNTPEVWPNLKVPKLHRARLGVQAKWPPKGAATSNISFVPKNPDSLAHDVTSGNAEHAEGSTE